MMSTTTKRRKKPATTAIVAISAMIAGVTAAQTAFAQQATQGSRRAAVSQGPIINRVVVEGNKRVEKGMIEPNLQMQARRPYNQATVDADVERILEIYRRQGRALANVTPRVVDLPNGRVDVVYTINEGDKTGVKEIRFVGNNQVSASRLRGVMATTETNILSFLKSTDVYDPNRIAADLELIRRYYLKNGYADFRIVSSDVQFDPNAGGYVVDDRGRGRAAIPRRRCQRRVAHSRTRRGRGPPQHLDLGRLGLQCRCCRAVAAGRHHRCGAQGLCVRAGSPASAPATRRPRRSISATWSRTARGSTSSASTCAATPAPATT